MSTCIVLLRTLCKARIRCCGVFSYAVDPKLFCCKICVQFQHCFNNYVYFRLRPTAKRTSDSFLVHFVIANLSKPHWWLDRISFLAVQLPSTVSLAVAVVKLLERLDEGQSCRRLHLRSDPRTVLSRRMNGKNPAESKDRTLILWTVGQVDTTAEGSMQPYGGYRTVTVYKAAQFCNLSQFSSSALLCSIST